MALENLKPEKIWYYFEKLTKIPRESGNCKNMTEFILAFAKEKGLCALSDAAGNVVVKKPASKGYENAPCVIIQGHMDMVCVKTPDRVIDFSKDPIIPMTDGNRVWADRTSLGADDGIGVAYALALLEDDAIAHPALECLFTVDEETGLIGANELDASMLSGNMLINLDSESEGYLTVSCAGGLRALGHLPIVRCILSGDTFELSVSGLLGGHSGVEINKNRTNSIKLLGRILNYMAREYDIRILDLKGGSRENVIASEASATIMLVGTDKKASFLASFTALKDRIEKELAIAEPNACVSLISCETELLPFTVDCTQKCIFLLYQMPFGIQSMNPKIEGLVQTSINCGILSVVEDEVQIKYSVRSSVSSEKTELKERLESLYAFLDAGIDFMADYPAWEYSEKSPLRDIACEAYKNVAGKDIMVIGIHAGLECGIFAGKKPGLDCISFGPDLFDVHSVKEETNVGTVARSWDFLLEILRLIK